jgi:hypothetical protein
MVANGSDCKCTDTGRWLFSPYAFLAGRNKIEFVPVGQALCFERKESQLRRVRR